MKKDEIAAAIQPDPGRTVAAFPGLMVAGEREDVMSLPFDLTMTEDWYAYANLRIQDAVTTHYGVRPNFLRFLPDPATMEVILLVAKDEHEYGAQAVKYTETENGFYVNVRLPLKQLKVAKLAGRVRVFPVTTRTGADGKTYLAFSVKDGTNRPIRAKKGSKSGEKSAAEPQAENK